MVFFTLCADDYGLNTQVNEGIHTLIRAGRLNATSCMTVGPAFEAQPLLDAVADAPLRVQIGLHLTLTEYTPLGDMPELAGGGRLPPVGRLLADSHLRRIDRAEIAVELGRQFDAFEEAFGRAPDFVDGHQHIQIFPGIRSDVIDLMVARMGSQRKGWIRCCGAPLTDLLRLRNPRALLLAAMARRQRSELKCAGLLFNERFYGVNRFDPRQSFRKIMQGWLGMVASGSEAALVMCHPGGQGSDPDDPIAARRPDELVYLASDDFAKDMASYGVKLA